MADSVNLSIPASAAERADINTITQLLAWYRNGNLNNEQMIKAIRDFAKVSALSPHDGKATP